MPSVGLQISLLLSCFVFTLSYGAGYYTMTDSNCSIYILNIHQEWGLRPMPCQVSHHRQS